MLKSAHTHNMADASSLLAGMHQCRHGTKSHIATQPFGLYTQYGKSSKFLLWSLMRTAIEVQIMQVFQVRTSAAGLE